MSSASVGPAGNSGRTDLIVSTTGPAAPPTVRGPFTGLAAALNSGKDDQDTTDTAGERDREPAASQARAGRGPGITVYHEGAVILDGELYSPGILNYPALLELAPPPIGGIRADWAAYHADVALRAPFRLRDQGRPGPDGHARRGCPANGLVKNPALGHLAPGRIRVRGGAKFSLLVAFCVAAMNLRFTDTWAAQQHTWAARHGTHPTRPVRRHRRSQPGLTQLAGHPVRHSGRAGPPAQPART
jgi:hypothetical protein